MHSRLRLEELGEGRVVHLAVEGGLKSDGLEAQVEKRSRVPLRAGGCLAPRLVEGSPIELQVEAQVVGDGKWGSLIEIGDEVGGDGGLASVLAPRPPDRLGLLIDPPGGRKAEKSDVLGIGGRGLKTEDRREVNQGECGSLAGELVEPEAGRPGHLKPGCEAAPRDHGRAPTPKVG